MEIFGPLVFSSVIATLTVRGFVGGSPLYDIPAFKLNGNWEIIPYLLLGVVAGLAAPWFLRLLRATESLAARIAVPVYVKMFAGGLIVGALAILHPEVCGNGYSAVSATLRGDWVWQTLEALDIFTNHDSERLPVVSDISDRQLVGSIFWRIRQLLCFFRR